MTVSISMPNSDLKREDWSYMVIDLLVVKMNQQMGR